MKIYLGNRETFAIKGGVRTSAWDSLVVKSGLVSSVKKYEEIVGCLWSEYMQATVRKEIKTRVSL